MNLNLATLLFVLSNDPSKAFVRETNSHAFNAKLTWIHDRHLNGVSSFDHPRKQTTLFMDGGDRAHTDKILEDMMGDDWR